MCDNLKGREEKHQLMKYPCRGEFFSVAQDGKKSNKRVVAYSDDSYELIDLNVKDFMEGDSNTEDKKGENCITELLDDYMP